MISIRPGTIQDLSEALSLIHELAVYEKAPEEVVNTIEMMERDGFGEDAVFKFLVAEEEGTIAGMSMYYYRYSTWKGKRLYLEDLIVREEHRAKGIGKLLFDATVEAAKKTECTGMMWQVLDWNEPAINFYKKYPTRFDEGWINCHLDF